MCIVTSILIPIPEKPGYGRVVGWAFTCPIRTEDQIIRSLIGEPELNDPYAEDLKAEQAMIHDSIVDEFLEKLEIDGSTDGERITDWEEYVDDSSDDVECSDREEMYGDEGDIHRHCPERELRALEARGLDPECFSIIETGSTGVSDFGNNTGRME